MKRQPYFAVRVVIRHADGGTSTRDYVRGSRHMGRDTFTSFAVGDMISLCVASGDMFRVETFEVGPVDVMTAERYEHLTHGSHNV